VRLLSGQESGLIIVIALMMIGLTLRAPTIEQRDAIRLPASASVKTLDDGGVSYTGNGRTSTVPASQTPTLSQRGDEQLIFYRHSVNKFLNAQNLIGNATQAAFIAIMAVGMMGIIILGGIDLSIGSIYALAGVLGGFSLQYLESQFGGTGGAPLYYALPVAVGVCCLVGGLCGFINGAASVGLGVHPFIITLGGMAIYRGITFRATNGQTVSDFPASLGSGFFRAELGGVSPVPSVLMVVVGVFGAFVLSRTVFGRQTYAIGGNEVAARYAGVPTGRVKIAWYTISGVLAGLSAAMLAGYYGAVSTDAGSGYELSVIAAAVVGGASLAGGRGTALGAVLGAIVIQLINNAIIVLDINENYKQIIIGLAIVLAVVVDQTKAKFTK
jgi:ribose transport system permease protein